MSTTYDIARSHRDHLVDEHGDGAAIYKPEPGDCYICDLYNSNTALLAALEAFSKLCPSNEGLGGWAPRGAFSIAADQARAAIAEARGEG